MIDAAETDPTAPETIAPVDADPGLLMLQLAESAEVFWLPRRGGRMGRGIAYRRFDTLAEAVSFSVEGIPSAADIRVYTDRGLIPRSRVLSLYAASIASLP